MKKIVLIIFSTLILIASYLLFGKNKKDGFIFSKKATTFHKNADNKALSIQQTPSPTVINVKDVEVKTLTSASVKILNASTQAIIAAFGTPNSIGTEYFEMSHKTATIYNYNGATLYFVDNKLTLFELTNQNFRIKVEPSLPFFSVGNTLDNIHPVYETMVDEDNTVKLWLKFNDKYVDYFITLEIDNTSSLTVTKIALISP